MESNITINIVEPGSTPIEPVVPDTGLFTSGIGGPEATILGITAAVIILAVVLAVLYYRNKKQGKFISLSHKKATTIGLASLAAVVSLGTVAGLLRLGANAIDAEADEAEEVAEVTDGELTIELGDTPVFAYVKSTVTVTEDMPAGYTLKAYSENSTLSAEGTDKTIGMVTIPEDGLENAGSLTTSLTDNTWGLAVEEPESEADEIYFSLPATAEEAITIATVEDMEAEGSDTVTVYYGVYITPDMPYGTYTGASVNYIVEDNSLATVIFDGNELYFNGDSSQTTNTAKYAIEITEDTEKYSHTSNIDDDGIVSGEVKSGNTNDIITVPGASKLHIKFTYGGGYVYGRYLIGSASFWQGSFPNYTADGDYTKGIQACGESSVVDGRYYSDNGTKFTVECDVQGDSVTFGYSTYSGPSYVDFGYYAIVTGYDADGNLIYFPENQLAGGEYLIPGSSSSTYYRFIGWDKNSEATTPTYTNEEDIAKGLALVPGAATTLYAIWEPAFTISYNGNGADVTTNMDNVEQYTADITAESKTVDLLASNFTRVGYGFAGWSRDADAWTHLTDESTANDPTIYGPNQTITVNPATSTKLALYAVWVPAEQSNGTPVTLQNWTGCNSLTATTYNSETGELAVGKNTITALTDARDGNVYTVAKLADGNCWTVENLKLDNEATIATTNTNNPIVEPGTTNVVIKNNDGNTSNHLSPTNNSWCTSSDAECLDQSNLNTNNTALTATSPAFSQDFTSGAHNSNFDANITSYGNYYNWYSATAGNGKQETSSNVTVAGDVCPTGWHLPYGGNGQGGEGESKGNTKGGFYYLNQQMGKGTSSTDSNNWRSFPNNFVYSGYWSGSSAYGRGGGYYWSSTASGKSNAYSLYLGSGNVSPVNNNAKNGGYSVRCLAPGE